MRGNDKEIFSPAVAFILCRKVIFLQGGPETETYFNFFPENVNAAKDLVSSNKFSPCYTEDNPVHINSIGF